MVRIKFYYKPQCWFCENAEAMLMGLEDKYNLQIEKIDITQDDELYELYRYDIPVLEFEDGTVLYRRIKRKDLLQAIERNKKNSE